MINLTADIPQLVFTTMMPFIRVGAMIMVLPIIGTELVPAKIKLIISICLTLMVINLSQTSYVNINDLSLLTLVMMIIYQIIVGVLFGLIIHAIFQAFVIAGQILAMQMGLGFAQMIDPQNGVSVPTISQFYTMMATLLYLAMNGHLYVVSALIESFNVMPATSLDFRGFSFAEILNLGSVMFSYGLKIALPAIVALLITNVAFGVMTKAAPQFNLFSIGFSISMIIGIGLIWITLGFVNPVFQDLTENVHITLFNAIE